MAQVTAAIVIYKCTEKFSLWIDFIVEERLNVLNLVLLASFGCSFLLITIVTLLELITRQPFGLIINHLVQFFDPGGLVTDIKSSSIENAFFCVKKESKSAEQPSVSPSAEWLNVFFRWAFLHFQQIPEWMNTWLVAMNSELAARTRRRKERLSIRFENVLPYSRPPIVSDFQVSSADNEPDLTIELDIHFPELIFIVSIFQEDTWPKRQLICEARVHDLQGRLHLTVRLCTETMVVSIRFNGIPSMNIVLVPQDACAEKEFKTIELQWMREKISEALMKGVTEITLGSSLTPATVASHPENVFGLLPPNTSGNLSPSGSTSSLNRNFDLSASMRTSRSNALSYLRDIVETHKDVTQNSLNASSNNLTQLNMYSSIRPSFPINQIQANNESAGPMTNGLDDAVPNFTPKRRVSYLDHLSGIDGPSFRGPANQTEDKEGDTVKHQKTSTVLLRIVKATFLPPNGKEETYANNYIYCVAEIEATNQMFCTQLLPILSREHNMGMKGHFWNEECVFKVDETVKPIHFTLFECGCEINEDRLLASAQLEDVLAFAKCKSRQKLLLKSTRSGSQVSASIRGALTVEAVILNDGDSFTTLPPFRQSTLYMAEKLCHSMKNVSIDSFLHQDTDEILFPPRKSISEDFKVFDSLESTSTPFINKTSKTPVEKNSPRHYTINRFISGNNKDQHFGDESTVEVVQERRKASCGILRRSSTKNSDENSNPYGDAMKKPHKVSFSHQTVFVQAMDHNRFRKISRKSSIKRRSWKTLQWFRTLGCYA